MEKKIFLVSPRSISYLLPLLFFVLLTGCEKEAVPETFDSSVDLQLRADNPAGSKMNTFYGPAEPFNGGVVRAVVTMTRDGVPVDIGVRISEKVLEDLPEHHEIVTLDLPNKMKGLAFDHVDLDWNPHGHEPFFYELPHSDVHFYMIPEEEKWKITEIEKAALFPDPEYLPESYFTADPVEMVPNMGVHWLDFNAPELPFNEGEFTHTMIYGTYDNRVIFMEPMITLDYLLGADGTEFDIPQPQKFERSGYYPTTYKMYYNAKSKEYVITMGDMEWYNGSEE
ncbi:DUF5602 domain-containing protein [Salinimicrobium sp. HB62]|uniref:DUF5602 domain-containing protein n=1 Tax=Salinimicrobium sp. HB62 TaxID=3077781 RepID=UPI002D76E848|nr:DUF5602 domain-containing protein [Salinimicrobium sp. HB62]